MELVAEGRDKLPVLCHDGFRVGSDLEEVGKDFVERDQVAVWDAV